MSDTEEKNGSRGSRSPSRSRSKSSKRSRSHSLPRQASRSGSRAGSANRKSGSRSRSRSRSRSSRRNWPPRRSAGHSDSGGHGGGRRSGRSRSRSPMSRRRRHNGNRDDPEPNRCLGVFGLSLYTQERDVKDVFGRYGPLENVQVVYDHQTGRSRGFAFVYYEEIDDAVEAKERCNGIEIDGRRIRVDFSVTERAHTPTPGVYLGKPTRSSRRRSNSPPRGYNSRRSASPSRRGRYSRSRSRSYSPRRY